MAKFRGLIFFASWRLGWTILIWLFIVIIIVLLFRCLRAVAESAGAYLETALDHHGFPVSRLQRTREQDICRANRELQIPSPNLQRAPCQGPGSSALWSHTSRISPEPSISELNRQRQNRSSSTSLPASPSWFTQIRSTVNDLPPDYDQLSIAVPPRNSLHVNNQSETYRANQNSDRSIIYNTRASQQNSRISSLDVNDLEAGTSNKTLEEDVEPPPYESLFPDETENSPSSNTDLSRREEQRE